MMSTRTFCRLCDGACGVIAEVADGRLSSILGDSEDKVSEGFVCDVARRSPATLAGPTRVTTPLRREGGRLVPSTWDEAIRDIGARLQTARKRDEARSVGMYLGDALFRSDRGLVRALATAAALGTTSVFSELSEGAGPRLLATEQVLGHPALLLPDIGRAHYVLVLGGDEPDLGWGPRIGGRAHGSWLTHSRKTKGTKLVVAGPAATPFALGADQHLAIRPGTETFLLLGMLAAIVRGDWHDAQFVRDYTEDWDRLVAAMAPWTVDRCAEACGIDAAVLSGVALKFARAAMAVVVPGDGAFAGPHGGVGAWAWVTLHTVTANLLRPGGLYDHEGLFDAHHLLAVLATEKAPRTRVGGHPLLLLQAPAAALVDEVLVPGEGQVSALLCVRGDPVSTLTDPNRTREALGALETLVCLSTHLDQTTELAHWVLPIQHPWEREDFQVLASLSLPRNAARHTPPVVAAPEGVRHEADVLEELVSAVGSGVSRGGWGWPVALAGRTLARADLATWERRLAEWSLETGWDQIVADGGVERGDSNRAVWRVSREGGRLALLPAAVTGPLSAVREAIPDADFPCCLRTSHRSDVSPDAAHRVEAGVDTSDDKVSGTGTIGLHPSLGHADGAMVRVVTLYGAATGAARLDDTLRPDTVDIHHRGGSDIGTALAGARVDTMTGGLERDGAACRVEPA
jgi:anaerobic selenocysteine-containing dehydrogenase